MTSEPTSASGPAADSEAADLPSLSADDERLLDEFDVAWHSGHPPSIDAFLARRSQATGTGARHSRYAFLTELIKMDLEYRWRLAGAEEGEDQNDGENGEDDDSVARSDGPPEPTIGAASTQLPPLPVVEDYNRQFPMLQATEGILLDLIAEEYRVRRLWGDSPRQEEYHERFPENWGAIQPRLRDVELDLQLETQNLGEIGLQQRGEAVTMRSSGRDGGRNVDDTEVLPRDSRRGTAKRDGGLPFADDGSESHPLFGRYEILDEVARGGMGIVYRARHVELDRIVALKVILSGELASAKEVARFEKEARAAANLHHPGIVPIYDVGTVDGRHYFSMAYIEGESLTEKVADGPLDPRRAAEVCAAVADAIQYAHEQNVIHRDLKPANILIDSNWQPKITDFGLAKRMGDESGITTAGQILGTPSCMPPEQAEGQLHLVGPRSDIYSIGAVLYMLLTGRPPFQASNPLDTLRQVIECEPVSPRDLNNAVPADLESICLKCLQKPLSKRYQTARELADDLRRFLRHEPPLARPMSTWGRMVRWCQRKPLIAALSGVALLLTASLVAVGWIGYVQTAAALTQLQREQAETRRQRDLAEHRARELGKAEAKLRRQAEVERIARRSAESAEQRALAAQLYAEKSLYFNRINAAQAEWHANHLGITEQILDSLPAEFGDRWDQIRGWEWDYLKSLCHLDRLTVSPLSAILYAAALSPDGAALAVAGDHHDLLILDPQTGAVQHRLSGHEQAIRDVCFNASGDRCATAGDDRTVRIWSLPEGKLLHTLTGDKGRVQAVQFSAMGDRLVSAGDRGEVLVWDPSAGSLVSRFAAHAETIYSLSLTADGKKLATASQDGTARVWTLDGEAELELTLVGHSGPVYDVAWNAEGDLLATSSQDGTVKFWDAKSGATLVTFQGHQGSVYSVSFLPDGELAVSSGRDGTVRLWSASGRREVAIFRGHVDSVYDVAADRAGRQLYSVSRDRTLKSWDIVRSQPSTHLQAERAMLHGIAFDPSGKLLLGASDDGDVKVWNITESSSPSQFSAHSGSVLSICCDPTGKWFLTSGGDRVLRLWNLKTQELVSEHTGQSDPVRCTAFGRLDSAAMILSGGESEVAHLWDAQSGELFRRGPRHDSPLRAVGFLGFADGNHRLAYSASSDGRILIWEPKSGDVLIRFELPEGSLTSVAASPSGELLAVASDSTIQIWNWRLSRVERTLRGHGDAVTRAIFSPDGARLASTSRDGSVRVWDTLTGQQALVLEMDSSRFIDLCFTQAGDYLAALNEEGRIQLWKLLRTSRPEAQGDSDGSAPGDVDEILP